MGHELEEGSMLEGRFAGLRAYGNGAGGVPMLTRRSSISPTIRLTSVTSRAAATATATATAPVLVIAWCNLPMERMRAITLISPTSTLPPAAP